MSTSIARVQVESPVAILFVTSLETPSVAILSVNSIMSITSPRWIVGIHFVRQFAREAIGSHFIRQYFHRTSPRWIGGSHFVHHFARCGRCSIVSKFCWSAIRFSNFLWLKIRWKMWPSHLILLSRIQGSLVYNLMRPANTLVSRPAPTKLRLKISSYILNFWSI